MNPDKILEDLSDIEFAAREISRAAYFMKPKPIKKLFGMKPTPESLAKEVFHYFCIAEAENIDLPEALSKHIKKELKKL
jgi:hypothetical protein